MLGLIPVRRTSSASAGCLVGPLFQQFLGGQRLGGFFTAGLATGFLPCGLVYSFVALAVSAGNVGDGLLLMACFGLGTVPAMVAIGCGGAVVGHATRARVFKLAACLVIAMGAVSIYRAIPREAGRCPACHDEVAASDPPPAA
ncbi:MAG: sulfite exporter TauE/SafE family protein [bacterium]|nr:sulfite exporter TauE/SafE family protein [bacterium]